MINLKIKVPNRVYEKIRKIPEKKMTTLIVKTFQKEYDELLDMALESEIKNEVFQNKYKKYFKRFKKEMGNSKTEHNDYIEWSFYYNILSI